MVGWGIINMSGVNGMVKLREGRKMEWGGGR